MSDTEIKICGLSSKEAISAAIEGGADYIGLIFFETSPRDVSLEKAAELSGFAGSAINKVAVTVDASDEFMDQIVEAVAPDMLQLHGSETPQQVKELKAKYKLPVMKAIAVSTLDDLSRSDAYENCADRFLFDAKAPKGSDLPGGNAVTFDWTLLKAIGGEVNYMLSGGLNVSNISQALRTTGAKAVDVSSGVESSPGIKDIAKITAFIKAVKAYDKQRKDQNGQSA